MPSAAEGRGSTGGSTLTRQRPRLGPRWSVEPQPRERRPTQRRLRWLGCCGGLSLGRGSPVGEEKEAEAVVPSAREERDRRQGTAAADRSSARRPWWCLVRPVGGGGRSRERLCSARVHGGRAPRHGAERSKETTRGRRRMERAGAGLGLSRRASTVPWRACGRARGHAAAACCARSAMTSTSSKSTQELAIPPQKYTETPIFLPS